MKTQSPECALTLVFGNVNPSLVFGGSTERDESCLPKSEGSALQRIPYLSLGHAESPAGLVVPVRYSQFRPILAKFRPRSAGSGSQNQAPKFVHKLLSESF